MTDDELKVIKAMAMGYLAEYDSGYECVHCNASATKERKDIEIEGEIYHNPGCPVLLARQILHDAGTPMNIYKITGRDHHITAAKGKKYWKDFVGHTLAVSEQEAIANCEGGRMSDIHAEFVRVMPLDTTGNEKQ